MSAALWQCAWCRQTPEDDTARKVDANQPTLVRQWREAGVLIADTHELGGGMPDVIAFYPPTGRLAWFEIKVPCGALTPKEREFHEQWQAAKEAGVLVVVRTFEDGMRAIGAIA